MSLWIVTPMILLTPACSCGKFGVSIDVDLEDAPTEALDAIFFFRLIEVEFKYYLLAEVGCPDPCMLKLVLLMKVFRWQLIVSAMAAV